jgi:pteridine reductase
MNLDGANVLITGGGHRLGGEIAVRLAGAGANLALNYYRSPDAAEQTRAAVEKYGGRCVTVQADAADSDAVAAMIEKVEADLGGIDLWVASAGAFRRMPLESITPADWDEMMRANFLTFTTPAQQLAPRMRERGGCIIAMADVAAVRPWADHLPYSIAKSCLLATVRRLAVDLAPKVRVNAIAPGPVLLPPDFPAAEREREISRTLLAREGNPQNIARAVIDLAENDYVTGVLYPVDGGRMLR